MVVSPVLSSSITEKSKLDNRPLGAVGDIAIRVELQHPPARRPTGEPDAVQHERTGPVPTSANADHEQPRAAPGPVQCAGPQ